MALSHPMIIFSLFLTFLALSAAQSPMMAPIMPPSTMAIPPTTATTTPPPMSAMSPSPPPPAMSSPPMSPMAPSMSPLMGLPTMGMGPRPAPGPMDGAMAPPAPSSGFVQGSSLTMVAILGSVALFF
ncbi:hypothetical protein RND71_015838 [Anisodus tanguticus]|uniref:Uncharacterized protein n=1 Tax=Anisodus tanguticus TaxID=243964 RepID=A0AAE1VLG8_9SOLA|nr:hypothetical protein RND71_015838 [Anisodus tanguticus]